MTTTLRQVQDLVLSIGSGRAQIGLNSDRFLTRTSSALESLARDVANCGAPDVTALVRQALLRCHVPEGDAQELRIPRAAPWPSEEDWRQSGCETRIAGPDHYLVRVRPWVPGWLKQDDIDAIAAAFQELPRRTRNLTPADPLVTDLIGYKQYASPGQQAAVRSVFLMPRGSSLVINLPTGAGKTLCFQLPALAWAPDGGLTLVIVPTVALARDQEARFRVVLGQSSKFRPWTGIPLAYHSGLDDSSKQAIRSAIWTGSSPIVFASAQAAMGPLRAPLFEAARHGRLQLFAIDEAHLVSQWGQQFCPELQSIAGLREALLEVCPANSRFRTLLLSATVSRETFGTLSGLYHDGGFQMVSETSLRQEPAYLLSHAPSDQDRTLRVLDAIRSLPRPMIIYSTLRQEAERFYALLLQAGYRRVRLVRGGDLSDSEGEQILEDWRAGDVDIVVATSAFGLGMDLAEVRAVVHACVPETIDRYYQEVGRAGRDGNAAIALMVSAPSDFNTARSMAQERVISVDRAFERWDAMWTRRKPSTTDGIYIVSLDDRPADLTTTSVKNASWNLRTLVLMARAGLIRFASHPPPDLEPLEGESDSHFDARRKKELDRFFREVAIKLLDAGHSDRMHWDASVAKTRKELKSLDDEGVALVQELRRLKRPLGRIFTQVYAIPEARVHPVFFAGSCPITREQQTVDYRAPLAELTLPTITACEWLKSFSDALEPCRDASSRYWLAYERAPRIGPDARKFKDKILSVLRFAVSSGVAELAIPEALLSDTDWSRLSARSNLRLLLRTPLAADGSAEEALQVPRLSLLDEDVSPSVLEALLRVKRPHHILILPRDLKDPIHPARRLFDVQRHLSIEELLGRLTS